MSSSEMEKLFDVMGKIETNKFPMIESEDKKWCEELEKEYHRYIKYCDNLILTFETEEGMGILENEFYKREGHLNKVEKKIIALNKRNQLKNFVNDIIRKISKKYGIDLKKEKIYNDIGFETEKGYSHRDYYIQWENNPVDFYINHEDILEAVVNQLDVDFETTRTAQRLAKFKSYVSNYKNTYNGDRLVEIEKNDKKLKIYFWDLGHRIYKDMIDNLTYFLEALHHFEMDTIELTGKLKDLIGEDYISESYGNHYLRDGSYQKHSLNINGKESKIKSIRFYKNGRIDLEFNTELAVNSFLEKYCN